jgi:hypothetical protein
MHFLAKRGSEQWKQVTNSPGSLAIRASSEQYED